MNKNVLEYIIRAKDVSKGTLNTATARIKRAAVTIFSNLMNIQAGFNMVRKAAVALAGPLASAFKREAITVQFATLFKSLTQARKHMKELAVFAAKTPFQMEGIAKASRQLYVFSAGVLGSKETLRLVGDAASATGNSMEELSFWVGRAYSMIAAGKPFGEAALRLQELGVLTPTVRQKMEDLQATGASSAEVWRQLRAGLEGYSGGMQNASVTGEGLVSTLKDVGEEAKVTFGKSFMNAAKGGIQYFIDLINNFISDGTIERWAERTKNLLLSVFGAMKGLSDATTRTEAWGAIKDVVIGGFETGAVNAVNILGKYLPTIGVTLGKAIIDAVKFSVFDKKHKFLVQAATEMGILKPGSLRAKLHDRWWKIPDDEQRKVLEKRADDLQLEQYAVAPIKASDRMNRGLDALKALGSGFEEAGAVMQVSDDDFKQKNAAADAERLKQRKKEAEALIKQDAILRASAEKERIEKERQERLKMERELAAERKRLLTDEIQTRVTESTKAEAEMSDRVSAARAKVAQAWGWYRNKDSLKTQLEEEKAEAAAQVQFGKDLDRLKRRKYDWRTAKNLSIDDEAVRRVGVALEEEAAAQKALVETAENTRKLNEKFDAVISMKGGN